MEPMSAPRTLIALLLFAAFARGAAALECDVHPVLIQIDNGVYLPTTQIHCTTEDLAGHLRATREWLGLCRELGGDAEDCAVGLLEAGAPSLPALVDVALGERQGAATPVVAPVRVTAAHQPVWRGRHLTNAVVASLPPVKRAASTKR